MFRVQSGTVKQGPDVQSPGSDDGDGVGDGDGDMYESSRWRRVMPSNIGYSWFGFTLVDRLINKKKELWTTAYLRIGGLGAGRSC